MEPWIPIAVIAAVAAVVYMVNRWFEGRYNAAWQKAAFELGLTHCDARNDLLARFPGLTTLHRGRKQQIVNAIVGNDGHREIVVADFRFVTGGGQSTRRQTQTLCIVRSEALDVPSCVVRPQSRLFDFLGKLFGGQDIDIAEDPEFSRAYVLQSRTPDSIRRVFDAPTRFWFVQRKAKYLHFEAGRDVFLFHYGRKLKPAQARELIAEALEIHKLLAGRATMSGAEPMADRESGRA